MKRNRNDNNTLKDVVNKYKQIKEDKDADVSHKKKSFYAIARDKWQPCDTPKQGDVELSPAMKFNYWMNYRSITHCDLNQLLLDSLVHGGIDQFMTKLGTKNVVVISLQNLSPIVISECIANSHFLAKLSCAPIRHTSLGSISSKYSPNLQPSDIFWRYVEAAHMTSLFFWPIIPIYREVTKPSDLLSVFLNNRVICQVVNTFIFVECDSTILQASHVDWTDTIAFIADASCPFEDIKRRLRRSQAEGEGGKIARPEEGPEQYGNGDNSICSVTGRCNRMKAQMQGKKQTQWHTYICILYTFCICVEV